ncbi:MAG: phosphotransferase [Thermomicrobiales bacterium]
MKTPPSPDDLDPDALAALVAGRWGLPPLALTYQALGFGSHHWRADAADGSGRRWFLTVDTGDGDAFASLKRALRTASALHAQGGIAEVVAPLPDRAGEVLATLPGSRGRGHGRNHGSSQRSWAVAVYPWLEVEPSQFGAFASDADREAAQRLVARLHAATPLVPMGLPRRDDLGIPHRAELDAALTRLEAPWTAGPFAEPAREVVRAHRPALLAALAAYDRLAAAVLADPAPWVITHGEPHAGNIVRRRDGAGLAIVDWDTCALAPRERDLWQLLSPEADPANGLAAYREIAGDVPVSANALALYRLWWDLCEVAVYTVWFTTPHAETEDMRTGFGGLRESVGNLAAAFA